MAKRTQIVASPDVADDIGNWITLGEVVAKVIDDFARRVGEQWHEDHDLCRAIVATHASSSRRSS